MPMPRKSGKIAPYGSNRKLSILESVLIPLGGNTKEDVQPRCTDFDALTKNSYRRTEINGYRNTFISTIDQIESEWTTQSQGPIKGRQQNVEVVTELVDNVNTWIIHRYDSMLYYLRQYRTGEDSELSIIMKGYNLVLLEQTDPSADLDIKLCNFYRTNVDSSIPEDFKDATNTLESVKKQAKTYILTKIQESLKSATVTELIETLYLTVTLTNGAKIFVLSYPYLLKRSTPKELTNEVLPIICLLCATSKNRLAFKTLETVLRHAASYISIDVVNTILEYSAHSNSGHEVTSTILNSFKTHVAIEGLITAYMVAVCRGKPHLCAIYQVFIGEMIEVDETPDQSMPNFSLGDTMRNVRLYFPPLMYIFLALSANSPLASDTVIDELIEFFGQDPLSEILKSKGMLETPKHEAFVDCAFNIACNKNQTTVVQILLDSGWVNGDFVQPIHNAVKLGNANIINVLLGILLEPDPKIKLKYGAIPLIFRKPKVLNLLPLISERFPDIGAWFVDQISNIPIPLAVPPSERKDPIVHSRLMKGMKLGQSTLQDVSEVREGLVPDTFIWNKLEKNGQLRMAMKNSLQVEVDCVVCMIPDVMLTERGFKDIEASSYSQTNSFINLLESEDESIILSPAIQGMKEFYWAHGHFWARFTLQVITLLSFLLATGAVFAHIRSDAYILHVLVILSGAILLIQEYRQYLFDPKGYFYQISNQIDIVVYLVSIISIVTDTVNGGSFLPPLLKALIVLLFTMRMILHLRIVPSVGPVIRIMTSALVNVVPILVPMVFLQLAFALAFFVLHQELIGPNTAFSTFPMSVQMTLTMIMFDYS
jgi:hypothetical protein